MKQSRKPQPPTRSSHQQPAKPKPKPKPKPEPERAPEPLQSCLTAVQLLLAAFAHRNKNQHRASHWWSSLSYLRRSLRNLEKSLVDLATCRPHCRPEHDARVQRRTRWLSQHVVPRAYLKFTQLAADNQHAALGLMLLAVLGRVHECLPGEDAAIGHPLAQDVVVAVNSSQRLDKGIVVLREERLPNHQPPLSKPSTPPEPSAVGSIERATPTCVGSLKSTSPTEKLKKRKKKKQDALSDLFSSLS